MKSKWDNIYKKEYRSSWYPKEEVVVFTARHLKRRVGIDVFFDKRNANTVLDIGCGNGNHVKFYADLGYDVHGIDISSEAIEIANAWMTKENLKANLLVGDIEILPFEDNYFDVIISHGVLDHIPFSKAKNVINEVVRVLKPNGLFFVTLRSTKDLEFGVGEKVEQNTYILQDGYEKGMIQHFFDADHVSDLVKKFNVIDVELGEKIIPDTFGANKAFLQSSGNVNSHIDSIAEIKMNHKYSRWYVVLENR